MSGLSDGDRDLIAGWLADDHLGVLESAVEAIAARHAAAAVEEFRSRAVEEITQVVGRGVAANAVKHLTP